MDRADLCDGEEALTPAAIEARAAIERIAKALEVERAETRALADLLRAAGLEEKALEAEELAREQVPHIDATTPPDEDPFFELLRIAYPGNMSLGQIGEYMIALSPVANRRPSASKRSVANRKPDGLRLRAEPMSRERVRQIEAQGLAKLRALKVRGKPEEKAAIERMEAACEDLNNRGADLSIYATNDAGWPTRYDAARARDPQIEKIFPDRGKRARGWGSRLLPRTDEV